MNGVRIAAVDETSFSIADIPGLVEGASEGIGLGHDFLRHVERTRMLVHILDISGSEGRDPIEDYETIMAELAKYGELADSPMLLAANKMDIMPDAEANLAALRAHLPNATIFPISAATRQGLTELLREIAHMLDTLEPATVYEEEMLTPEIPMGQFDILREGGIFAVQGPAMDRLIESVNFGDYISMNWFQRTLRKIGVVDALREKGAKEGDTVRISDMEFDFVD